MRKKSKFRARLSLKNLFVILLLLSGTVHGAYGQCDVSDGQTQELNPNGGTQTIIFPTPFDCNAANYAVETIPSWMTNAFITGTGGLSVTTTPNTGSVRTGNIVLSYNDGNGPGQAFGGFIFVSQGTCNIVTWYLDADNDGFHAGTQSSCTSPGTGWTTTTKIAGDCNDSDAGINPDTVWYLDADGDGFHAGTQTQCTSPGTGWTTTTKTVGDCNDNDSGINPNTVWYLDADNDGFHAGTQTQCTSPGTGYTTATKQAGDCNDADAALNPDTIWYADVDGDGYADEGGATVQQCNQPAGSWTLNSEQNPCGVTAAERQILLDLYNATNGDNWTNTVNGNQPWDTNIPVCDWYGVNVINGNITSINLNSNNLVGSLPTSLGGLSNLTSLVLSSNLLEGPIPEQLGQLSSLTSLSLNACRFSGAIPSELGQLTNLTSLILHANQLSGAIPAELGQLTNLITLSLYSNELTGTIPAALGGLSNLQTLSLLRNQLTGSIPPELGQLSNLRILRLTINQLSGPIPPELGQLINLTELSLNINQLSGPIPTELGLLSNLSSLSLTSNELSGNVPQELASLLNLNSFYFNENSFIFSNFETEHTSYVANLSNYLFSPQAKVDLEETLSVPENESITFTSTALTSPNNSYQWFKDGVAIPGATSKDYVISNATPSDAGVYYFEATNSIVTGLTLTRNNITLTVDPPIDTCGVSETEKLALLDLYNATNGENWNNTLAGNQPWDTNIPVCDWFGVTVVEGKVAELNLVTNALTGALPASLGDLTNLTKIYIRNNNSGSLSGSLPASIGNMTSLIEIDFQGNQLSGVLPPGFCNLTNLVILNLFSNDFSGAFPSCITSFASLERIYLGDNNFNGSLPTNIGVLSNLRTLDVSRNNLTGTIPSSVGDLAALEVFFLYSNQFSGEVPNTTDNLLNLQFVRFHDNLLEGKLPSGFANLEGPNRTFSFQNNFYHFEDFEEDHPIHLSRVRQEYTFAPQKKVDQEETFSVPENESVTLTTNTLTSPNNSYQWFKDGTAIPGATSKDYIISNATSGDAGTYYFEATNSIVTGLTITRNNITLTIDPPIDTCGVSETEKQALLDLYTATNGDNWTNTLAGNQPWDTNIPVCDWFGITVVDGKVTVLEILNNNLVGSMPASIGDLIYLERLRLVNENWGGSSLPATIGNLTALTYLQIGGGSNGIGGSIPTEIGNLTNLISLNFTGNQLVGPIPESLGNLTNLTEFYATNNGLESIPNTIGNLTSLANLYLSGNNISSPIPAEIGQLASLRILYLGSNNIPGVIPPEMGNLNNLDFLHLYGNELSGALPPELGNIQGLEVFYVYGNNLSGSIPSSYGNWSSLRTVGLQENSFSGPLPIEWSGLTSLTRLSFDTNNYIFADFENDHPSFVTNASILYEYSPQAKVDLEETLSVPENESITLTSNALTSVNNSYQWFKDGVAIPGATSKDYVISNATPGDAGVYYFEATNSIVTGLTLTRNNITLTIDPPIDTCGVSETEKQALLDLYNATNGDNWTNTLAGNQPWDTNIPVCDWYGVTVVNDAVVTINLYQNNLVGTIPASIAQLSEVYRIDFGFNQLSGSLPEEIGSLVNLEFLFLTNNTLSGILPSQLGQLSQLRQIYLNRNNFTGSLPPLLSQINTLTKVDFSFNDLSGLIPDFISTGLTTLVFSQNGYVFSDFESGHPSYANNLTDYTYAPQAKVDLEETLSVPENESITLTSNALTSVNNSYQWFRDGVAIPGATSKDYVISNATPTDAGVYYFEATNSTIMGLTLTRNNITLTIEPPIDPCGVSETEKQALLNFYNATNGDNWTNTLAGNQPWDTNIPVCDWYGVIVVDGKVTRLLLQQNNLEGSLSSTLDNLVNFEFVNLDLNNLSGNLPSSLLQNNPGLLGLDIRGNRYVFSEIEDDFLSFSSALGTGFKYQFQQKVDLFENLSILEGQPTVLTSDRLTSPNNSYQWYKDGNPIPGATSKNYTLPSVLLADAGIYHLEATNSIVSGLTISRNPILVYVSSPNPLDGIECDILLEATGGILLGPVDGSFDSCLSEIQKNGSANVECAGWQHGAVTARINVDGPYNTVLLPPFDGSNVIESPDGGPINAVNSQFYSYSQIGMNNGLDFSIELTDLTVGNSYMVQFYQANGTDLVGEYTNQNFGGWKVDFGNSSQRSPANYVEEFPQWTLVNLIFQAEAQVQRLRFTSYSNITAYEADRIMLIDGIKVLEVGSDCSDGGFVQNFCTMNGIPTVADLSYPVPDDLPPSWYLTETGGTALPTTEVLMDAIYWLDFPGNSGGRIEVSVSIDRDIPTGDTTQEFDFTTNPTLADIVVTDPIGNGIEWYDSVTSEEPLPITTPLVAGQTYFALAVQEAAECRLGITVEDSAPGEICVDVLVEGSGGGSSVVDGSFEAASNVLIPNNRNESLGSSGWGATSGTPDTFLPPYDNPNDPYLTTIPNSSPNGGICAGALRVGNTAESMAANIDGLEAGAAYYIEFYQANISNILVEEFAREANGFWEVSFGGSTKSSNSISPGTTTNVQWTRQRLEFTPSSTVQLLEFKVGSTTSDQTNAYPVYMLIDGIRVYQKPASILSTECYPLAVQEFCTSTFPEPTIADLIVPGGGSAVWYNSQSGGRPYSDDTELLGLSNLIFWADTGSGSRSPLEVILDLGAPVGDELQIFDIADNPTIGDIQVEGNNISWYDQATGGTILPTSTPLSDEGVYFAEENGVACRLEVSVDVGIPIPFGSGYQEFCSSSNPTVADLEIGTTNPGYTIVWYNALEDGSVVNSGETLVDGTVYYAAQTNGSEFSEPRRPIRVSVIDAEAQARLYERDIVVPQGNTIADLTNYYGLDGAVVWYDQVDGGTAYFDSYTLVSDETYYARIGDGVCDALEVLAVTITIGDVVVPELITCIKFIPQPGDRYVISGWVREDALIAEPAGTKEFNSDTEAKEAMTGLFQNIADMILERREVPVSFEVNTFFDDLNADALLPYIKNFTGKSVTVFNFEYDIEISEGIERAIGFSFSLSPDNTERFRYRTPEVNLDFSNLFGVQPYAMGYNYPIRNYEGLEILFTDATVVNTNTFRITSNFRVPPTAGSFLKINYNGETFDSTGGSGLEGSVQLFNYSEDPGYQVMDYLNTSIELQYKDVSGADIPLDSANAIFKPKGSVIDGWQRISSDFTVPAEAAYMRIDLKNTGDGLNAYFDDVRMHPFDSNMKSFVYDPVTQRLQAELDENNYATFYEYDTEGGLVRVKKETERGVYTIQETRSGNSKLNSGSE
ncbi:hypothetical protein FK220_006525 [Flavobacteriaceae bacterium TP-CH-4]|uniref:Ig-like domain-containing protein n=1 Tax=Pelagihabitans pacificus TaxID=2696054 RepID=A0A967ARE1_9FLAO|nr:immunoglobulin domain-containing protein [Pelagihabitans pacificus]NHF58986.1 hypothetical protein [Pelagihabitans pacificus]